MSSYFGSIGRPIPTNTNPAEYLLDLVNSDFSGINRVEEIHDAWANGPHTNLPEQRTPASNFVDSTTEKRSYLDRFMVLAPLLRRSFMKSHRDVLAYGVRYAMYFGLAIMMGTVWLRLKTEQDYIQSFINAIVRTP